MGAVSSWLVQSVWQSYLPVQLDTGDTFPLDPPNCTADIQRRRKLHPCSVEVMERSNFVRPDVSGKGSWEVHGKEKSSQLIGRHSVQHSFVLCNKAKSG